MPSVAPGPRPNITPAQWLGAVPVVANMLHAFGLFTLSEPQQESLEKTITYAIALVGGDALLRVGRNIRDAQVQSALVVSGSTMVPPEPAPMPPEVDPEERVLLEHGEDLPDDDEEFAAAPPDESNTPVQPSQIGIADALDPPPR